LTPACGATGDEEIICMTQPFAEPKAASAESASELLERTLDAFPDEKVNVGALIDYLDDRGYGLLLLLLALPMCVPNVPGISTPFGFLLLIPALGMILGARRPWIPGFIARQTVDRKALAGTVKAAAPMVRRSSATLARIWPGCSRAIAGRWE
jgi:hypothetical protein